MYMKTHPYTAYFVTTTVDREIFIVESVLYMPTVYEN